jgi:hypothetical protein
MRTPAVTTASPNASIRDELSAAWTCGSGDPALTFDNDVTVLYKPDSGVRDATTTYQGLIDNAGGGYITKINGVLALVQPDTPRPQIIFHRGTLEVKLLGTRPKATPEEMLTIAEGLLAP